MRFRPQDKHQTMLPISVLKHVVVLSKFEGPQKWLAPCGIDVHRVARTLDVCVVEQESHRHIKNVKWGTKSTKHGNFGCNVCLFPCAIEAFLACVDFRHVLLHSMTTS
jgi:hypothetical protein